MENASKALLMAAGILVGVLILALMVTLFISAKGMSTSYDTQKQSEAVQQFNVNFTKYLGQKLTIHDVVTICNFAVENGFEKSDITGSIGFKTKDNIPGELNEKSIKNQNGYDYYYIMSISSYNSEGKVSKITINSHTEKK